MTAPTLPCPFSLLVPQAPPMRLEGLLREMAMDEPEGACTASAEAPVAGLFVEEGCLLPEYVLELLAQSVAAGHGYLALAGGCGPAGGMLAGIDHLAWSGRPLRPGDRLTIRIEPELAVDPFLVVHGTIRAAAAELAQGRLTIRKEASPLPDPPPPAAAFLHAASPSLARALQAAALQKISRDAAGTVTGIFHFAPDFPGFRGHFPGRPLLPAVVQCAAVRLLAEQALAQALMPAKFLGMKWIRPILPGETVTLSGAITAADETVAVSFTIAGQAGRAASGTAHFRPAGP